MNKKRIIFLSVCTLLLLSLVTGTLAWFYVNEDVTISYGNSVFCEAGDSLEISLVEKGVNTRWTSSIDYSGVDFTLIDISGDGINMYRPMEIDENQQPVAMQKALSSLEEEKNYDYLEMEISFRSTSKMDVYFSEESFILPVNPENTTSNIYGTFSRDYIAGAMRVAMVDASGDLRMLWAPNSKYHLIQNTNGSYSFKPESTPESAYYYFAEDEEGNVVQKMITEDFYGGGRFVVDSTGATKETPGKSPLLVSLNPEGEGSYDQKNVKIRIWFEGTDREAHQALAGGNVKVKLKFVGIAKEKDENKQAAIDAITFNQNDSTISGMKEGMVFSTDGINWTEYKSGSVIMPVLQSGESIYIKYPETDTHCETNTIQFTKE